MTWSRLKALIKAITKRLITVWFLEDRSAHVLVKWASLASVKNQIWIQAWTHTNFQRTCLLQGPTRNLDSSTLIMSPIIQSWLKIVRLMGSANKTNLWLWALSHTLLDSMLILMENKPTPTTSNRQLAPSSPILTIQRISLMWMIPLLRLEKKSMLLNNKYMIQLKWWQSKKSLKHQRNPQWRKDST